MSWKFPTYNVDQPIDWLLNEQSFEWFREMKTVPQDPVWHGEGNVFIHTKMVVEAMLSNADFQALDDQQKHILFTAAMLHDVEKRSTTTTEIIDDQKRIVSPGHARKGALTTRTILYKEIPTPFPIREQIANLVRLHGLPLWITEKAIPRQEVIAASLKVNTKLLAILAEADVKGRICTDKEDLLYKVDLFREFCMENECFGIPRTFKSKYGRYQFLTKPEVSPDYEPFDDLKFDVHMMSGLPGSGKDTFIKNNLDLPVISLDEIRREHRIAPTDKKANGKVIQLAIEKVKVLMRKRTSFVFNATNLTKNRRSKWTSLFIAYGGRVLINYIEVPYRQLLKQNHNREHKVPEHILEKMIKKLEVPDYSEAHEVRYITEEKM